MKLWLDSLGYCDYSLQAASEDASFRRYFRLMLGSQSWIVMDAPPEKESCNEFIDIANRLSEAGLNAPLIVHQDLQQGFLVLTDFGNTCYLQVLDDRSADSLYGDAMAAIVHMQDRIDTRDLPLYDERLLRREMGLFREWFLEKLLGIELNAEQSDMWQRTMETLVQNALEQPQVFVHRDYHSRNLMQLDDNNPGIIDFQDAVKGPVTYDLVSLLRDCYLAWPEDQVERWARGFCEKAGFTPGEFMVWFNLMGVQRHLKAVGIFSRLHLRDGKPNFLADIPRTLNYIKSVSSKEVNMVNMLGLITQLDLEQRAASLSA